MSTETAKKRKRDGRADEEGNGGGVAGVEKILAEMKAQMMRLQNELDDTKGRLSHLDELESRSTSMQNEIDEMKSRVSHMDKLEHRCKFLERSVQILKKEAKWEYSAPAISARHWIDQGYEEGYAVMGMGDILRDIKEITCELRSGACRQDNVLSSGIIDEEEDEVTVLRHDDALLPHWQEFANALQLYQNSEASHRFFIYDVQLTSSVIDLLTPALKDRPIVFLGVQDNEFVNPREGVDFAVEFIQSNQLLKRLRWANNPIDSMNDATHLVEAIIGHPLLDWVRLENCFGGNVNAHDILCSLFTCNKHFSYIHLDSNNIRTEGGTEIPDFLARNPPLEELCLASNHLDDNDAILIARALKRNTNLQSLDLGQNEITDIGGEALGNAIFDATSLNSVADSNHTCCIVGMNIGIWENCLEDSSEVNRGRKIYSLLSSRHLKGSNVQHLDAEFEDDDLNLVPHVLKCVNIYAEYYTVRPLSVMYEILRSWKMPTLYESNGAS